MIAKKRLSLTIFSSLVAELLGKIVPLAILAMGQRCLGIETLGFILVGITLIEMCFPFISFGYNQYATIEWGTLRTDQARRQMVRDLWALKGLHALVAWGFLLGLCWFSSEYRPYLSLMVTLGFVLLLAAVECLWIQVATQKIAMYGLFNSIAKIVSVVFIYFWVKTPADGTFYALGVLGANGLVCLFTVFACRNWIPFRWASFSPLLPIFHRVKGYAAVAIWLVWMDRVDMFWVNHRFSAHEIGLYAGASRLNQALLQLIWILAWAFFSEAVVTVGKRALSHHLQLATFTLFSLLAPISVGIFFFAEDFLLLLVGPGYTGMTIPLSLLVLGSIGTAGILLLGQQVLQLRQSVGKMFVALVMGFGLFLVVAFVATPRWGLSGVAASQLVGKVFAAAWMLYWAHPFLDRVPWREVGSCLLPAMIMGLGLYCFPQSHWAWRMALAFGIYGVSFVAMNHRRLRGWRAGLLMPDP